MPSEDNCKKLIGLGVVSDIIDLVEIIPVAGKIIDSITDQVMINTELELLTPEEFNRYRRYYALPASIRAMLFCYINDKKPLPLPLPELPRRLD